MFRKLFAVVALAITALFLSMGIASAADYVPPAVTSSVLPTSSAVATSSATVQVLDTSKGVAGASLSYTGTGFNVGGVVTIGLIVVLVGIGLCIVGAKMSKRRSI